LSYARFSFAIFSDFKIFVIFNTLLFLIVLYLSFLKFKDEDKLSNITFDGFDDLSDFFINILKTKVFRRLYLFYLTPSIIVWLYPTLLSWFGLTQEKSPISLNILSSIFLLGLLLVIFKINKNNRKIKRELLKEEIKRELMQEFDKK
jgi:RsiW-degrading membrane proteinase PrsW (M82 family)